MQTLLFIATVSLIHILGLMSPGPDFIMAARNSLTYSRRTGIWTAVGFGLGVGVHISYCLAGLALVISQSILLFNSIKFIGAGYLIYIGIKSILAKSSKTELWTHAKKEDISKIHAVKIGFLTNVLNPKATLFFMGLFTLVISPDTSPYVLGIISLIMILTTMAWFSFVAIFLTHEKIRSVFERFQGAFNKTFGGLLVALGVKVALSER